MSMFSLLYSIGTILAPPATSVIMHDAGYEARFTACMQLSFASTAPLCSQLLAYVEARGQPAQYRKNSVIPIL